MSLNDEQVKFLHEAGAVWTPPGELTHDRHMNGEQGQRERRRQREIDAEYRIL